MVKTLLFFSLIWSNGLGHAATKNEIHHPYGASSHVTYKKKDDPKSIESFGAIPNDSTVDNSPFIIKALSSANAVLFPAKTYYIKHLVNVKNLTGVTIYAKGSRIINSTYGEASFEFLQCSGITIDGGYFTRPTLPMVQNGGKSVTLSFIKCKDITVTHVHINRSPEMGINLNNVINATISDNIIEHCLRDGVYAHYSANLKYLNNTLNEIKDDALSMHDYGIDAQKTMLFAAGYKQAGHSEISGNKISNAIEGISSVGCTDISITNNTIDHVVHAGISILDDERLLPGTTARANKITISGNILGACGDTVTINTMQQVNYGQISDGRAAIFIGAFSSTPGYNISLLRLSDITISNNKVSECAGNGATLYNVDGLTFTDNTFTNCHSDTKNAASYTGNILEFYNCTGLDVKQNSVIDTRAEVLHDRSYLFNNCTGTFQKGKDHGWALQEVSMIKSSLNK